MTINEIVEFSGLSKAAFSRLYKIPIRTLEDWASGRRLPRNDYVFYLLERVVRYDKEHDNFLDTDIDRQIKEMKTAKTDDEIIDNRFL